MELSIRKRPDPVLTTTCRTVEDFSEMHDLAVAMRKTMEESDGAGLAAPQVGITKRLFVMNPTGDPKDFMVCINPKIETASSTMKWAEESCLSLPGVIERIRRHTKISVRYATPSGMEIKKKLKHWGARVFQHELDHLDGILITDGDASNPRSTD